jgi:uncharacterized protein (TIGR02246 family)
MTAATAVSAIATMSNLRISSTRHLPAGSITAAPRSRRTAPRSRDVTLCRGHDGRCRRPAVATREALVVRHNLAARLVILSLFASLDIAAQAPSGSRSDEEAIAALMAATTEAFSRHDAKAWVKFCTTDAHLVTVRGESMKGIAEIEKGLSRIFETRGRNVRLKTLGVTVRFIRPDVALAHVTNELSGLLSPEGQTQPPHQELSIRVLVKDQGTWRITAFHNTILQK